MKSIKVLDSEISMFKNAIDIIKLELYRKKKISIAFSGGKTPIKLFELLALEDINWENINIFLVDERWVPLDHIDSNYGMIKKKLLENITIPSENIHHINYSPSIEKSKEKYEGDLLEYFQGDIVFDLIFLGVGNDGHTASIFEKKEVDILENVIITSSKRHPHRRISLGMGVINKSKRKIFLLGPKKLSIIDSPSYKKLPISKVISPEFFSYIK